MDLTTGKWIEGRAFLEQSIRLILRTPKASRLIKKEFGSSLFDLIDSGSRDLAAYTLAVSRALEGLQEFRLRKVSFAPSEPGRIELEIEGDYLPASEIIRTRVRL